MTQSDAPGVRASFKAAPDSLIATFMIAFLATAGLFYVNIMPAIVSGVMDGLGVNERQAGYVASTVRRQRL